jgi:hypothetical protein
MTDGPGPTAHSGAVVELRTYLLHPGTRAEYDRVFREDAGPLLARFDIDVVAYGPSLLDDDQYFLIRAYPSLTDRAEAERRFYSSSEWRDGPREAVLSRLISYHELVLPATPESINALRTALSVPPEGDGPS